MLRKPKQKAREEIEYFCDVQQLDGVPIHKFSELRTSTAENASPVLETTAHAKKWILL